MQSCRSDGMASTGKSLSTAKSPFAPLLRLVQNPRIVNNCCLISTNKAATAVFNVFCQWKTQTAVTQELWSTATLDRERISGSKNCLTMKVEECALVAASSIGTHDE